jgi:RNase H-fold protein (predicted Holliday junction resolvase)
VETYDERLTSALSERRLREIGVRTGHARARVDQGAAVALLESYLLRLKSRDGGTGAPAP